MDYEKFTASRKRIPERELAEVFGHGSLEHEDAPEEAEVFLYADHCYINIFKQDDGSEIYELNISNYSESTSTPGISLESLEKELWECVKDEIHDYSETGNFTM